MKVEPGKAQRNGTMSLSGVRDAAGTAALEPSLCLVLRADAPLAPPRRFRLVGVDTVIIGRGDRLDAQLERGADGKTLRVSVADGRMSTRHVRCFRLLDRWVVEDAGSKNGTLVDGKACLQTTPLAHGQLIEAGGTFFFFEEVPAGAAPAPVHEGPLATETPALAATFADLVRIAAGELPILLLGESGVGKEVLARTLHERSRRSGPLVAINCAALPASLLEATLFGHRKGAFTGALDSRPGLVRSADRGTLFLDEVGELSAAAQATLLRVLQEREVTAIGDTHPVAVDVRFIAATNRDLEAMVEAGEFRADLLARLSGLTAELLPLRERRADLGLIVAALLARHAPDAAAIRLTAPAARAILRHDWPLNVRQLEMALRAAGELAGWGKLDLVHLPEAVRAAAEPDDEHRGPRAELTETIRQHGGNLAAVARALNTSRMQVHRLMKRYGVRLEPLRK